MSEGCHRWTSKYDEARRSQSPNPRYRSRRHPSTSRGSEEHDAAADDMNSKDAYSSRSHRHERSPRYRKDSQRMKEYPSERDSRDPYRKDTRRERERNRDRSHRHRSRSRSPRHKRIRYSRSRSQDRKETSLRKSRDKRSSRSPPSNTKRSAGPLPSQQAAFSKSDGDSKGGDPRGDEKAKEKPNYAPSGLLAAETNKVANTDVVLKYNEPPESRLPPASQSWRLYVFKAKEVLDTIPLHSRTCWLFGREKAVVDVCLEHPSCSKQHAVLQFRYVEKVVGEFGERKGGVGLYMIDLESANGTKLNGEDVPKRRFVECRNGDVIAFGESSREYVVLLPPKE